jgi:membrane protease YdiL (CAAX protease family)
VVVYIASALVSLAFLSAVGADASDDLPQELGADDSTAAAISLGALVTIGAPLAEEFFFRGYLFGALRRWKGAAVGAVIVGILFGLVHAGGSDPAYLLPLAVLGGLFCLLYAKTGSLYPCIVMHCINNCIAYGFSLDWTWQIPVLLASSLTAVTLVMLSVERLGGAAPRGLRPA